MLRGNFYSANRITVSSLVAFMVSPCINLQAWDRFINQKKKKKKVQGQP